MFSLAVVSLFCVSHDETKRIISSGTKKIDASLQMFVKLQSVQHYKQLAKQLNLLNMAVFTAAQPVIDQAAAETCSTRTNVQLFDQWLAWK